MQSYTNLSEQILIYERYKKEKAKNPNADPVQVMREIREERTNELLQLSKTT